MGLGAFTLERTITIPTPYNYNIFLRNDMMLYVRNPFLTTSGAFIQDRTITITTTFLQRCMSNKTLHELFDDVIRTNMML